MNGSYGQMVEYGVPTWGGSYGLNLRTALTRKQRIARLLRRAAKIKDPRRRAALTQQALALGKAMAKGAVSPEAVDDVMAGLDAEMSAAGAPLEMVPPNPIDVPVEMTSEAPSMAVPLAVGATGLVVTGLAVYFLFLR
jgi:hypothetical protein